MKLCLIYFIILCCIFWNNKQNFTKKQFLTFPKTLLNFLFDVVKNSKHLKYVIADIYSQNTSVQEILPLSNLIQPKLPLCRLTRNGAIDTPWTLPTGEFCNSSECCMFWVGQKLHTEKPKWTFWLTQYNTAFEGCYFSLIYTGYCSANQCPGRPGSLKARIFILPPGMKETFPFSWDPGLHSMYGSLVLPGSEQLQLSLLLFWTITALTSLPFPLCNNSLFSYGFHKRLEEIFSLGIKKKKKFPFCSLWWVDSQRFLAVSAEKSF